MTIDLVCASCSLVMGRVHAGANTGDIFCRDCKQAVRKAVSGVERTRDLGVAMYQVADCIDNLALSLKEALVPWYVRLWRRIFRRKQ